MSCVAVCVILATGVGSEDKAIELYLTDALTFPSRPVQLQARLTEHRPDGDHGMPEEPVEFAKCPVSSTLSPKAGGRSEIAATI